MLAVLLALSACGDDGDDETGNDQPPDTPAASSDSGEPDEDAFPPEYPVTTEDVVAVLEREVTQEGELCAWRGGVILVEVQTFGPGGQGFLETWQDDFGAQHAEVRDLDRGDGAVVGLDDYQGHAYVETADASWLLFVGNVECWVTEDYNRALTNLVDVILGDPAIAAGGVGATECVPGSAETAETAAP